MKIEIDVIIEEVGTETLTAGILEEETSETETLIAGTLEEETSETETLTAGIQEEETSEIETLTVGILEEETSETETLTVGILEEETSETEIQEITDLMAEKRKFLLIMTGLAQSVTILIFHLEKNVIVAESLRVVILVEEIIETDATIDQEIIGQVEMMASLENLGRQKENLQIMPTIEDQNRSMSVLEEEIAMIK